MAKRSNLEYPYNLFEFLYVTRAKPDDASVDINSVGEDQINGLRYFLENLSDAQRRLMLYRFKDGLTLKEIGIREKGVSRERIRQKIESVVVVAHRFPFYEMCVNGIQGWEIKKEQEKKTAVLDLIARADISYLELKNHSYAALYSNGFTTVGSVMSMSDREIKNLKGIGSVSVDEIRDKTKRFLERMLKRFYPDESDSSVIDKKVFLKSAFEWIQDKTDAEKKFIIEFLIEIININEIFEEVQ